MIRRHWVIGALLKRNTSRRGTKNSTTQQLAFEPLELRDCPALVVPAFSSLPGANHTIYLDFDGHITENTAWNSYMNNPSINSPAFT